MIRVYFDWNVISNYKKEEFENFREFIIENKSVFQFPFTPAHFNDLMKSYSPDNDLFHQDLENLEYLADNHFFRWNNKKLEILLGSPKDYFDSEKDNQDYLSQLDLDKIYDDLDEGCEDIGMGKMGSLLKSMFQAMPTGIEIKDENKEMLKKMFPNLNNNSSMWDLMKDIMPFSQKILQDRDYFKEFRKDIENHGFKLEENAGNWDVNDVIRNIDSFLQKHNPDLTFMEYVNVSFKNRKEPANDYEIYTTAYLLLDMIGYKSDSLPKPTNNMQNITTDAEHSFYSAYCDYFVVMDKKLTVKTKVLFSEFNVSTIVVTPEEFIEDVKHKIHNYTSETPFLQEAIDFINPENLVESYKKDEETKIDTYAFKLPVFYFDFFNYVIYQRYTEQNAFTLTFRKVFKNFSRFVYITEIEQLIDTVCGFFGHEINQEFIDKKQEFIQGQNPDNTYIWNFDNGTIKLNMETETRKPVLTYVVLLPEKDK